MSAANQVTVFERSRSLGGAFTLAGHAPLFQGVDANPESFAAYIAALARACRDQGATIRTGTDPIADPKLLDGFDHVVIATGAAYAAGLGAVVARLLRSGLMRRRLFSGLGRNEGWRNWFYYKARRPTGAAIARRLGGTFSCELIGDAARAGKSEAAITSAFTAAFGPIDSIAAGASAVPAGDGSSHREQAS